MLPVNNNSFIKINTNLWVITFLFKNPLYVLIFLKSSSGDTDSEMVMSEFPYSILCFIEYGFNVQ
jgi:hypothetical protein